MNGSKMHPIISILNYLFRKNCMYQNALSAWNHLGDQPKLEFIVTMKLLWIVDSFWSKIPVRCTNKLLSKFMVWHVYSRILVVELLHATYFCWKYSKMNEQFIYFILGKMVGIYTPSISECDWSHSIFFQILNFWFH